MKNFASLDILQQKNSTLDYLACMDGKFFQQWIIDKINIFQKYKQKLQIRIRIKKSTSIKFLRPVLSNSFLRTIILQEFQQIKFRLNK